MNKEELFLKYIDGQLTQEQKCEVELLLSEDKTSKQLFLKVEALRKETIKKLDLLNPKASIEIPPFNSPSDSVSTTKTIKFNIWHYAAMAAILGGVYFGIKQFSMNTNQTIVDNQQEEVLISKTIYKELDCYISPNRCWSQKQLNWTFIEIKP